MHIVSLLVRERRALGSQQFFGHRGDGCAERSAPVHQAKVLAEAYQGVGVLRLAWPKARLDRAVDYGSAARDSAGRSYSRC